MSAQVQRWMWVVNVIAILAGAWLLAGTANAIIANRLGAAPQKQNRPVVMGGEGGAQVAKNLDHYLAPIKKRNVFLHGEPIPDEEIAPVDTPSGAGDACTLPIQVIGGVVVSKHPELSLVTLQDNTRTPPYVTVLQVGERVAEQADLLAVREEWNEATMRATIIAELRRDGGRVELCRSDAAKPSGGGTVAIAPVAPTAPTGEGIKRVSDTQFEVSQGEIDAVMNGGLATMAQDVRIVPYFEGGVSKGFKLYSIKPGSMLSKIGLMNGDVISKVNGYDINSPEKALQVYGLLKSEKSISVDLTRNGQAKSISYSIR